MTTVLLSVWTNTFCEVWNEHALGHRNLTFGWPHIAGSAYQKWPTKSQCSFSTWTWEEKKLKRKTFKCDRSYQIPGQKHSFLLERKVEKKFTQKKDFFNWWKISGFKIKNEKINNRRCWLFWLTRKATHHSCPFRVWQWVKDYSSLRPTISLFTGQNWTMKNG